MSNVPSKKKRNYNISIHLQFSLKINFNLRFNFQATGISSTFFILSPSATTDAVEELANADLELLGPGSPPLIAISSKFSTKSGTSSSAAEELLLANSLAIFLTELYPEDQVALIYLVTFQRSIYFLHVQ